MQPDEFKIIIPENELQFRASKSSGPGGQHVNKVNTRITVLFDVNSSTVLKDFQKRRILSVLSGRADKNGVIHIDSESNRSQKANRDDAVNRLHNLIENALKRKPPRKKTRPPRSANRKRLEEKKKRGQVKKLRSKPPEMS